MKVCLQSGHFNKGGGAPNELATNKRITDRVAEMLRQRGFEVVQTDWYGYNDPVVTKTDFGLFLALHCDMDYPGDSGSGFADYPEPSTDGATQESQRICGIINDVYFKESGIKYVSHSNANTRYYYMWKYLTSKTPCVLLEMGQSVDPHDSVILADTNRVASAITRAICKAFNVNYEINTPPTVPGNTYEQDLQLVKAEIERLNKTINELKSQNQVALAEKDVECQNKLKAYKDKIINFINTL